MTGAPVVHAWRSQTIRLRYSLSYARLFEISFKALVDPRPFDLNRPLVSDAPPPVTEVPDGYDVVMERFRLLAAEIPVIQRLPNFLRYAPRQTMHYYTDLRGGPARAFQSMSSKTRSTLTRKVRKFKEFCGGELKWAVYRTRQEMLTFHRLATGLARKTYQQRLFESGLPETEDFCATMLKLADCDAVRGFLLFHGEKPVAYLYTPAPDGFLVYEFLGYDPGYASLSPGTVLHYLALESLYAEQRFSLYYWSDGYSQTKDVFSTGQVLGADVYFFRPTLRNRLAVGLHYRTDRFSEWVGDLLNRLQLKHKVKMWLKKQ